MNYQFCDRVKAAFKDIEILKDEPMRKHTTFRVGGPAEMFVSPGLNEIPELIAAAREFNIPVTVIGNGSNLLVGDKGISGLVLEVGKGAEDITVEGNRLIVSAGAMLSKAANVAASNNLGGMEFAAGIPGSLGGAVVMNAGAYGGEMKDIIESVEVLTADGQRKTLSLKELDLSYRHSCIPEKGYIVLSAVLRLETRPEEEIRAVMAELRDKRVDKQPLEFASAGSTFKRPEGYFAGKLIQDAGLRGYSVGDAQVSEKHCGFVINRGNATAAQILELISDVQKKVLEEFGVELETEVKMIGEF